MQAMEQIQETITKYTLAVTEMLEAFGKKQGIEYDANDSDLNFGKFTFNDHYLFTIEEIHFDLKSEKNPNLIKDWFNHNYENCRYINYMSYCMGARHDMVEKSPVIHQIFENDKRNIREIAKASVSIDD